jgi:hypothetical protein
MRSPAGLPGSVLRLALLGTICLVGASCARSTGATGSPSSPRSTQIGPPLEYGGVLTLRPADTGKTVVLGAGDTLVFTVTGASASPRPLAWHIVSYPKNLLTLISRSTRAPFRFRALHAGEGDLRLSTGPPCGGPGPLAAGDQQCPVTGDSEMGPPGFATRLLVFHLKVLPRG